MSNVPGLHKVAPVLRDWINPFLAPQPDPERALQDLRKPIEAMISHLSIAAGLKKGLPNEIKIQKLRERQVVPSSIAPYLQLWWQLSCLGSHYQSNRRQLNWALHHEQVSIAAKICLNWFGQSFPSLVTQPKVWSDLQKVVSSLPAISLEEVVVPRRKELLSQLQREQVLVLEGASWVGKTSIAASLVYELSEEGFVPLVFHQKVLRSLVAIPEGLLGNSILLSERRTFKILAPKLHSYIATRLFEGESFVIWLDDPFGHRSYKGAGILDVWILRRLLELSQREGSLGNLYILLSTPSEYLETVLKDQRLSPFAVENRKLFHQIKSVTWTLDDYDSEGLNKVVQATAVACDCTWANRVEIIELVSEYLADSTGTFLGLRSFCKTTQHLSDEEILDRLLSIEFLSDLHEELSLANEELKRFLCLVLISELRTSIRAEFGRIVDTSFNELCILIKTSHMPEGAETWVGEDTILHSVQCGPAFRHPDLLATVKDWIEGAGRIVFLEVLQTLIFSDSIYVIPKLEAPHILCGFAQILDDKMAYRTHNSLFMENKQNLDVRNTIWAIVSNWYHIRNSALERQSMGFLRSVISNFKGFIRPLLSELLDNWRILSTEPRILVVQLIKVKWDDHQGITFLSGFIRNHKSIQAAVLEGCIESQVIVERAQKYLKILKDRRTHHVFQSRVGDQLFEQPGVSFSGQVVLQKLQSVLLDSGVSDDDALLLQLDGLISQGS